MVMTADDDDVALAAELEPMGAGDEIERLIPRHVLQPQRDRARDVAGDHDVDATDVGKEAKHVPEVGALEVEVDGRAVEASRRAGLAVGIVFAHADASRVEAGP